VAGRDDQQHLVADVFLHGELGKRHGRSHEAELPRGGEEPPHDLLLVGDGEADLDAGVAYLEGAQDARQDVDADGTGGGDTKMTADEAPDPVDGVAGVGHDLDGAIRMILQGLSGFGELQASASPREELHPQRRLEAQDLARDGGLGEGEIAGGVGHGLVPGHDEEGPELGEGHVLLFRYVMAQMTNMRL
jgi:hypothetical protein